MLALRCVGYLFVLYAIVALGGNPEGPFIPARATLEAYSWRALEARRAPIRCDQWAVICDSFPPFGVVDSVGADTRPSPALPLQGRGLK